MKKTTVVLISFFLISMTSWGQLKVDKHGHVGMGTIYPNPGYQCHIKDNLLISSYPAQPYYELVFRASNPEPEIGSSGDVITFWKTWVGHNKLIAQSYDVDSDSTLKTNITPINNGLETIMKIKSYSYKLKDNLIDFKTGDSITNYLTEYGFISQEIKETLKGIDITDNAHGILVMNYDQIIPLTVAAIKDQQIILDSLSNEIEILKKSLNNNSTISVNDSNSSLNGNVLYQNKPNPFKERTTIQYIIEEDDLSSASILIFDMNGSLLKSFPAYQGKNNLIINGRELKAGMYIYSLVVNNKEIDTKRMILIN